MSELLRLIQERKEEFDTICAKGFAEVDKDNSGEIEKNELHAAMRHITDLLNWEPESDEELDRQFAEVDKDGSGHIDLNEFKHVVRALFKKIHGVEV